VGVDYTGLGEEPHMDNWNRWGAADERGPANLIDADAAVV
jgi:hypothetical protein